jgi:hypothetical protein
MTVIGQDGQEYPEPVNGCSHGADGSWLGDCPVCVHLDEDDDELQELVGPIVTAVDERPITLAEKILEIAIRLLELVTPLDDTAISETIDVLTEVGVNASDNARKEI